MIARPWIPDTALTDGYLTRYLDEIVQDWAFEWLGDAVVSCNIEPAADTALRDDLVEVYRLASAGSVAFDSRTRKTFPEKLLKLSAGGPELNASDKGFVASLFEACTRDLLSRVSVAADRKEPPPDRQTPTNGFMHFDVTVDGDWTARLSLTHAICIALRRSRVGMVVPKAAFGNLAQALSATKITVAARAGVLKLGMKQLNELATGDVLVLDGRVDESFVAMVDGCVVPDIHARYVLTECSHDKSQRAGLILEAKHE